MAYRTKILSESDKISLSVRFRVSSTELMDTTLHIRHRFHGSVRPLLSSLMSPIAYCEWLELADNNSITRADAHDLILFLNDHFALTIRRSLFSHLSFICNRCLSILNAKPYITISRSWNASLGNVITSTLRTLLPVFTIALVASGLIYCAGGNSQQIMQSTAAFILIIWISILTHEAVHMYLIKNSGTPLCIVKRGLRIGILHSPMSMSNELVSALCGPLAGLITAMFIGVSGAILCSNSQIFAIGIALAGFHCLSFMPAYGDGKVLRKFRRAFV